MRAASQWEDDMAFPTESVLQIGVETYNQLLEQVWSSGQEELELRATAAANDLVRRKRKIKEISQVKLDFASPPELVCTLPAGVRRVTMAIEAPGEGGWGLSLRAKVKLLGDWHTIKVRVANLRLRGELQLASTGPLTCTLLWPSSNVDLGDLDIDCPSMLLGLAIELIEPLLEEMVKNLLRDTLKDALPEIRAVREIERLGLADEPPHFEPPVPDLLALEPSALTISSQIQQHHLPCYSIVSALVKANQSENEPYVTVRHVHFGDSAIWTGHYIAAEAFRYAVTKDPEAVDCALKALKGLEILTRVAGEPGLLSRVAVPADNQKLVADLKRELTITKHMSRLFKASLDGIDYFAVGHITRDQYCGALFGTAMAADLFADQPELATLANSLLQDMAKYLVGNHFCPTEAVIDEATGIKNTSVVYCTEPAQLLAALQAAGSEQLAERAAMGSILWFFEWLKTLDQHNHYYKFNLEHSMALLLLRFEPDPERRQHFAQGLRVLRQALRYHANAYFNLVELATLGNEPEQLSRERQQIADETRHLIAQSFARSRLITDVDLSEDPTITKVSFPGLSGNRKDRKLIARLPVPLDKRPRSDFMWQRSPFQLRNELAVEPGYAIWPPGVDLCLTYWMARYLGL